MKKLILLFLFVSIFFGCNDDKKEATIIATIWVWQDNQSRQITEMRDPSFQYCYNGIGKGKWDFEYVWDHKKNLLNDDELGSIKVKGKIKIDALNSILINYYYYKALCLANNGELSYAKEIINELLEIHNDNAILNSRELKLMNMIVSGEQDFKWL